MRPAGVVLAGMLVLLPKSALSTRYLTDLDRDGVLSIGCLGDSNTDETWPAPKGHPRWCTYLARRMRSARVWNGSVLRIEPVRFLDFGEWGAPVCVGSILQTDAALAAGVDLLVTAFNSNDVLRYHLPPEQIVGCHQDLLARVAPRPVLIGTTPPAYGCPPGDDLAIALANEALLAAFPDQLVDFTTGFVAGYFDPDGIHLNDLGQERRALVARRALRLAGTSE